MPILPEFDAGNFDPNQPIDNPYFPLTPGSIKTFLGKARDEETGERTTEGNDFFTTFATKEIEGVTTVVVRDTAYDDGVLIEDTLDWFAQDNLGNVWYFGELVQNYRFDDEGNYVGTDNDGSWIAGEDGAVPGWIMKAEPTFGAAYYQEFAPGIAEDEGIIVDVGLKVRTPAGRFNDVVKTLDYTALEPDNAEFKYFAPGIGQVLADEGLDENGDPEIVIKLVGQSEVADLAVVDPAAGGVEGDGSELEVSVLSKSGKLASALGAYTLDLATGEFGEGRILFDGEDGAQRGDIASVEVGEGEVLGVFLIPDTENLGIDLGLFEERGLSFVNPLTLEAARIDDGLAPLVFNDAGDALPITVFHAIGNTDRQNLLNPSGGQNARVTETADATILGFEDMLVTAQRHDGDFNDLVVSIEHPMVDDGGMMEIAMVEPEPALIA